jgi:hypothetical protein
MHGRRIVAKREISRVIMRSEMIGSKIKSE